jgi:hypothetical protein
MLAAASSQAAYTITFQQEGSTVVATGSGSINTGGLTFLKTSNIFVPKGDVAPYYGTAQVGVGSTYDIYSAPLTPQMFGIGNGDTTLTGSGDLVEVDPSDGLILVPAGYVSGSPLSGSSTFIGDSFASLPLIPGTYVESFGSGPTADTFTVIVAPEPASLGILGMAGLALVRRRR